MYEISIQSEYDMRLADFNYSKSNAFQPQPTQEKWNNNNNKWINVFIKRHTYSHSQENVELKWNVCMCMWPHIYENCKWASVLRPIEFFIFFPFIRVTAAVRGVHSKILHIFTYSMDYRPFPFSSTKYKFCILLEINSYYIFSENMVNYLELSLLHHQICTYFV